MKASELIDFKQPSLTVGCKQLAIDHPYDHPDLEVLPIDGDYLFTFYDNETHCDYHAYYNPAKDKCYGIEFNDRKNYRMRGYQKIEVENKVRSLVRIAVLKLANDSEESNEQ